MNDVSAELTTHRPVRFTVDEFLRMDAAGVFARYARTELIGGEVLAVNAQYRRHARIKTILHIALADRIRAAGSPLFPMMEASMAIPPDNAPEPDILLTTEPDGDGLVPVASVALIVEVSDSTVVTDLGMKAMLYAAAAVPEYWVADVTARAIHQHWAAIDGRYTERRLIPFGEPVTSTTVPDLTIETSGL